ncbi:hypothetical protein SAMN02745244_01699 [Tessaracoccus bendigoensis DSM 12906]|uniref:Uncharacterized protein n=1 Tax=Tessaracoccus bendigoensis DSM 12906 TaxID=1123357 RepID=A0A1M6GFN1_9ACTN|nr:hypothetical protein [Tessaracoccus bendigoensis]SHJ08727.1 hypothetical protein SAMN02745244_01699 [Tessaracoccus bendigoensis DSM 12906]
MERVTFLPVNGTRISCLLNPEHLVRRREAGLRRSESGSGHVTARLASDDLLLATGGGRTEYDLDLLFDTELAGQSPTKGGVPITDVRDLTGPLWDLAENQPGRSLTDPVSAVRMFWGTWNVLCAVEAVAERLERFDVSGHPQRSWLRMRLVRLAEPASDATAEVATVAPSSESVLAAVDEVTTIRTHHVAPVPGVGPDGEVSGGQTWVAVAEQHYPGRPWLWRLIASLFDEVDGPFVPPGVPLAIPEPPPGVGP